MRQEFDEQLKTSLPTKLLVTEIKRFKLFFTVVNEKDRVRMVKVLISSLFRK